MMKLTEYVATGGEAHHEPSSNAVRFDVSDSGSKSVRVLQGNGPQFAVLAWTPDDGYRLEVTSTKLAVYLNGRRVAVGTAEYAVDGDVLRVEDQRFVLGDEPTFPRDDVEASLLASLRAQPWDDELRAVYADWLEEQGDHVYAEFLRVELRIKGMPGDDPALALLVAEFHTLGSDIGSRAWRVLVARPLIEQCDVGLELSCPKKWDALARTPRDDVRHCDACAKDVVFCSSIEAARLVARRGGCVAVDPALTRRPDDLNPPPMRVGRVKVS